MSKEQFLSDVREVYNPENPQMIPVRYQFMTTTYWGWKCGCAVGAATFKNKGFGYNDNECVDFCVNHYNLSLPYINGVIDGFDEVGCYEDSEQYFLGYQDGQAIYKEFANQTQLMHNINVQPFFDTEEENES